MARADAAGRTAADRAPGRLPGVDAILAVGSAKGGVGKSTVAVNLASALRRSGVEAGLLDADIYGPSTLALVGLADAPERAELTDDGRVVPLEAHGVPTVSFGFFLGEESPAVWRGPLVAKAVDQLSRGVVWPELDVLVVDLPPGTGDVPLSLTGAVVVDGGLVVTTPQRLAVGEARKCAEMFGALDVPTLGVIENLSHAVCECGRTSRPFGRGGGRRLAGEIGTELLAQVPLDPAVREAEDRGVPVVEHAPETEASRAFDALAGEVRQRLAPRREGGVDGGRDGPGDDAPRRRLPLSDAGEHPPEGARR
jgi:ATP-binding protein involved in chromosome partitioning